MPDREDFNDADRGKNCDLTSEAEKSSDSLALTKYVFPANLVLGLGVFALLFAIIFITLTVVQNPANKAVTLENYKDYLNADVGFLSVVSTKNGITTTVSFENKTNYRLDNMKITYRVFIENDDTALGEFVFSGDFKPRAKKNNNRYFDYEPEDPFHTLYVAKLEIIAISGKVLL